MNDKLEQLKNFVSLLRSGLTGEEVSFTATPDWKYLHELATRHKLCGVCAEAVKKADCPEPYFSTFKKEGARILRRQILFDDAVAEVTKKLDESGQNYVRLKGERFSRLYPKYGMREFADCDILVSPYHRKKVDKVFFSLGYKLSQRGVVHDGYQKEPILYFEMHRSLFTIARPDFFDDLFARSKRIEEGRGEFVFKPEDEYLYILMHLYKHDEASTGFRSYLDFYLYHNAVWDSLDEVYVKNGLIEIGLTEFHQETLAVANAIFGAEYTLTDEQLSSIGRSAVYGTMEEHVKTEMEKYGKSYLWKRVFMPYSKVKELHPSVGKFPPLYLYFLFYRIVRLLFSKERREKAKKQYEFYRKNKND